MPVITHFRKQGVTRSSHSSKDSLKILPWVEWHLVTIKTVHLAVAPGMADGWILPSRDWSPFSRLSGSSQECQEPCLALVAQPTPLPRLSLHLHHKGRALQNRTVFFWRRLGLLHLSPQFKLTFSLGRVTKQNCSQICVFTRSFSGSCPIQILRGGILDGKTKQHHINDAATGLN